MSEGATTRFWNSLPDWLRTASGVAMIAVFVWTARGIFDRQLASPAKVQTLSERQDRMEQTMDEFYDELKASAAANSALIRQMERDQIRQAEGFNRTLDRIECKVEAIANETSPFRC